MVSNDEFGKLSRRQQQNILSLRLKKDDIARRYGNKVQIVTTEDDVINSSGTIAIPLSTLGITQPTVMKYDTVLKDANGNVVSECSADNQPLAEDLDDILVVLRKAADALEQKSKQTTASPKAELDFKVPAGYKLVKVEDTDNMSYDDYLGIAVEPPAATAEPVIDADYIRSLLS